MHRKEILTLTSGIVWLNSVWTWNLGWGVSFPSPLTQGNLYRPLLVELGAPPSVEFTRRRGLAGMRLEESNYWEMWSWCQPNGEDSQRDACASGLVPEELRCGLSSSRRWSPSARGAFFSQALLSIFLPVQTPPVAQGPFQILLLGLSSLQDSNLLSEGDETLQHRSLVCYQGLYLLRILNLRKPMSQCGTRDDCAPAARLSFLRTPSFLWCFDLCSSCSILPLKFFVFKTRLHASSTPADLELII